MICEKYENKHLWLRLSYIIQFYVLPKLQNYEECQIYIWLLCISFILKLENVSTYFYECFLYLPIISRDNPIWPLSVGEWCVVVRIILDAELGLFSWFNESSMTTSLHAFRHVRNMSAEHHKRKMCSCK